MRRALIGLVLGLCVLVPAAAAVRSVRTSGRTPVVGVAGAPELTAGSSYVRRRGTIALDASAAPIAFRLSALKTKGVYNDEHLPTSFDLNHDGTFDPDLERFLNAEKYLTIAGRSYAFDVAADGSRVTLTPLATRRPDRAVLKTGYPAPDFAFVDIDGRSRRLSDFRGKTVLLDFWATWCPTCVASAPEMTALYASYHDRGFEIIGVEALDTREDVMAFTAAKHMPWTQTLEPDGEKGPIGSLYRIVGWPTSYLIGPDGKFAAADYRGEVDLKAELARIFHD